MNRAKKSTNVLSKGSKKLIEDKLKELEGRIEKLIMAKESYQMKIKEIDIMLTQLIGATSEISTLLPVKKTT